MIVKVQQSLMTTAAYRQCLIYNKSRTVMVEIPLPANIEKALDGRPKAYFEATVDADGTVSLGREARAQSW